ncbi:hypothetical protein B296_00030533 [Ensete ventricosum]|uniref:Uncharacterized protein n=1 Tax=Ensete ventricosum TaxID=4639 RepID=A0A426YRR2_ENSVE|nr:hypothetical protein B296_00030533 [Ensete ventricosum]
MGRWDGSGGKAWYTTVGDNGVAGEVGCNREGRWWPKETTAVVADEGCDCDCNCWKVGEEGELLVEEVAMAPVEATLLAEEERKILLLSLH